MPMWASCRRTVVRNAAFHPAFGRTHLMLGLPGVRSSKDSATRRSHPKFLPTCPARVLSASYRRVVSSTQWSPFSANRAPSHRPEPGGVP
jgi:hypothetical protein